MSEFTIPKLVERINRRSEVWDIEGPVVMEYQFLDHTRNQSNAFLTLQIGHHFALFIIANNKIQLAIGSIAHSPANPRRVWLIDAVARTLLIGVLMRYISPNLNSVPPYMLFPSVCRYFFDSLAFGLTVGENVVNFKLRDVAQLDRCVSMDYKL